MADNAGYLHGSVELLAWDQLDHAPVEVATGHSWKVQKVFQARSPFVKQGVYQDEIKGVLRYGLPTLISSPISCQNLLMLC